MKLCIAAFFLTLATSLFSAESLTQADREALLEKLEAIRNEADSKVDARFRTALSAFRSAMNSDTAAINLYLKCEEMVNFEERKRKPSDFRDWKRNNSKKLADADFKLALRYQLRWLVLTLEAASAEPDTERLAAEAARVLDSIIDQSETLYPHKGVLDQSVTGSVFARAYQINNIKLENWPQSPSQVQAIYDQILLPPLRQPSRISALKATWEKRMIQEGKLAENWTGNPNEKKKTGVRSPEYEKFILDRLPGMQWQAQVDLFKAGDQRAAALRMLAHIEKNISHKDAPRWTAGFTSLLQGESEKSDTDIAP